MGTSVARIEGILSGSSGTFLAFLLAGVELRGKVNYPISLNSKADSCISNSPPWNFSRASVLSCNQHSIIYRRGISMWLALRNFHGLHTVQVGGCCLQPTGRDFNKFSKLLAIWKLRSLKFNRDEFFILRENYSGRVYPANSRI